MERGFNFDAAAFTGMVDLSAERVGGQALKTTDDFFAPMENLLKPGRGIYLPDEFTDSGKLMDGWESRRKRVPGHDWCIIKLGMPGVIRGVDIDTNHFLGNHAPYASIEAVSCADDVSSTALEQMEWRQILPVVALKQGSQNIFSVISEERWTHIRLNIYPDGGVARLKVYGEVRKLWNTVPADRSIDLVAIENGGLVIAANDMFFGNKNNMIMPGKGINMGDGWETRRRRDPGNDWAIIKLGRPGVLEKIEVDTNHFKGNYPDVCWIEGCLAPNAEMNALNHMQFEWASVLSRTKLKASHQHYFTKEIEAAGPWSHLRLSIAPDGGISRLRVWGLHR